MALERPTLAIPTHSAEETEALGERLGRAIDSSALIALDGDLGAGKTCFVRGLARGLGVVDPVSSPTYALLQSYEGRLPFHHLDAWMEGRERAFLLDGGLEWIAARGVTVIEWAERVADLLPPTRISVRIERSGADERVVHVRLVGDAGQDGPLGHVLAALATPR
jgi:tRNA threonylcarbamoyladenosine biosynthesis protein TsaE